MKHENVCAALKVDSISNEASFAALQDSWGDLLGHSERENPFQSHQWLTTWWQVYGTGTLHIVTCRDNETDELIGALPLYQTTQGLVVRLKVLRFLGGVQGSADFMGCLARQGRQTEVYEACANALLKDTGLWDVIDLQDMDSDSGFCRYLRSIAFAGLIETIDPGKRCPYLKLPDSWEDMLNGVSTKVRQRIGYYRRSLEKLGTVELELITDPEALPGALADMITLRQDRMEQKGITTAKITDAYGAFHRELQQRFLKCDRLRLYFLRLDGQRIAYLYLFSGGTGIYFYQTGFDHIWSKQSVGFVLLSMVIEKSIADGYKTFEFLRGVERYKYEWGNVEEKYLSRISIYKKNPYGLTMQLVNSGTNFIRNCKCLISA